MSMKKQRPGYLSYLLRVWQTGSKGDAVWRVSLENPFTGERRGFASLQDMLAFLRVQIDNAGQVDQGEQEGQL